MCLITQKYLTKKYAQAMPKTKNFFTTILAIILWFFIKDKIPEDIETSKTSPKSIELNSDNLSALHDDDWIIIVQGAREPTVQLGDTGLNIAYLWVHDRKTAEAAARIGVKSAADILLYSGGYIYDKMGARRLARTAGLLDTLDYFIFFKLLQLRESEYAHNPCSHFLRLCWDDILCVLKQWI